MAESADVSIPLCAACGFALSYGPAIGDAHLDCYSAWHHGLDMQLDALEALGVRIEKVNAALDRCEAADKSVDGAFAAVFGRTP